MSAPNPSVARRRRVTILVGVLLLLATAAWALTRSPLLDVDHVVVRGNARVSVDEILAASGVRTGDPMAWLDPGRVTRGIEELPWVRTAAVARAWPDTLEITVREREPVAWVDAGEGRALVVDGLGRALTVEPAPPPDLPQLLEVAPVPLGGSVTPSGGAWLAARIEPANRPVVRSISVVDERATLVVDSGQEVRFGRLDHVADKMRATIAVLLQADTASKTYIDVRAPSTPVAG